MDAFLRTAAHLYLELPAGFDAEARTYARFLATAAPGRRKHIAEVIARELKTPADDDRLFEKPAGDLSEEELEAALERKRRSRELGDAFDKLNERG